MFYNHKKEYRNEVSTNFLREIISIWQTRYKRRNCQPEKWPLSDNKIIIDDSHVGHREKLAASLLLTAYQSIITTCYSL